MSNDNLSLALINELIPKHISDNNPVFIEFVNAYFKFLTSKDEDTLNEIGILNNIELLTDIDETMDEFLDLFQKEFGPSIPKGFSIDPRLFYKISSKFYLTRGSNDSIVSFFRLLFDDEIELYYPYTDVLIPSSGKWSTTFNVYLDNNGFLSDTKFLQDSLFYQKWSYVIKTGFNIESWRPFFKKLIHPAGFIFFGEVVIFITILNQGMPQDQPGFPSGFADGIPVIIDDVFGGSIIKRPYDQPTFDGLTPKVFQVELEWARHVEFDTADFNLTRLLYAYQDMRPFDQFTIEELESGNAGLVNVNLDAYVEIDLDISAIEYVYIATASQTIFTGVDSNANTLVYVLGQSNVYINGYQTFTYTETDTGTITLDAGVNEDDEVTIENNPYK